ncbi:retinol dehydrogenase 8-like [Amphiura filiformis]|uniref:retinol dehydrogenase 8-like n=1 Tax=Amphiura filiformis TaxID=82378 RepID=UPI003B2143AE
MAQVVLVTGCSKGLGEGIALLLAKDPQQRFKVYATMRNLSSGATGIKGKAENLLDSTLFLRELDVTKQDTIDRTVKEIIEKEGRIDVLVNNAGITDGMWWEDVSIEDHKRIFETNYFGCVRMTRAVVPYMKEKRQGRVIQISSVYGFQPIPFSSVPYMAAKMALEGFTESIAPPLGKFNVWVSLIEPGPIMTPLMVQLGGKLEHIFDSIVDSVPGEIGDEVKRIYTANKDQILMETQTIEAVAGVVKDTIVSEKPDFRVQTSEDTKNMAAARFNDRTGNVIMTQWMQV